MTHRQPETQDEAILLSTFTFLFRDVADRIVDYSFGNLKDERGLRRMGLWLHMDTGVMFLPKVDDYEAAQAGLRGVVWTDVSNISVKKKMLGTEIAVASRSITGLVGRVASKSFGPGIYDDWRRRN